MKNLQKKMHKEESAKKAPVAEKAWYDFVFVWYNSAVALIGSAFSNIGMLGAQLWNMIQESAVSAYTWMLSWVKK